MLIMPSVTPLYLSWWWLFSPIIWLFVPVLVLVSYIIVTCHWWCHWYHVMLMPMRSHNQKHHVTSHLNYLHVRNAMMLLMTLLAWLDVSVSADDITWPKGHVAPQWDNLYLRNVRVPLMILSTSHNTDANAMASHDQKCHVAPHFNFLNLRNAMVPKMMLASCDTCQCQWHQRTKKLCFT